MRDIDYGGFELLSVPPRCLQCLYDGQKKKTNNEDYLREVRRILDERDEDDTAPVLANRFDSVYEKYYGQRPSFKDVKIKYNDYVLSIEDDIRSRIEKSADPMTTAMLYARIGNYIDFATVKGVSVEEFLSLFDNLSLSQSDAVTMESYIGELNKAQSFLLLADNCGEIVLDKLYLEQLKKHYPDLKIRVMVRGDEVQNDATIEDARYVGMEEVAEVISNGNEYAGTIYKYMTQEAREVLDNSDVILSKGQGNYETLNGRGRHIFYSFLCKCDYFIEKFGVERYTGILLEEKS